MRDVLPGAFDEDFGFAGTGRRNENEVLSGEESLDAFRLVSSQRTRCALSDIVFHLVEELRFRNLVLHQIGSILEKRFHLLICQGRDFGLLDELLQMWHLGRGQGIGLINHC